MCVEFPKNSEVKAQVLETYVILSTEKGITEYTDLLEEGNLQLLILAVSIGKTSH